LGERLLKVEKNISYLGDNTIENLTPSQYEIEYNNILFTLDDISHSLQQTARDNPSMTA
jgi:hypothetical protein